MLKMLHLKRGRVGSCGYVNKPTNLSVGWFSGQLTVFLCDSAVEDLGGNRERQPITKQTTRLCSNSQFANFLSNPQEIHSPLLKDTRYKCKPKRYYFDQNFLSTSCTVIWWWGWVATVATFCSKIRLPAPALLCSTWERELGVVARRDGRYCWCSVNQSLLFGQNVKFKSDQI